MLAGTIFADRVQCFPTLDSTNTAAMRAAAEGAPEGTAIVAEEQTAGRGRGGHSWHSEPASGIYVSVVLRPQLAAEHMLLFSLSSGLAVQSAVERACGIRPDIRWPNDLLLNERKFCGILAESSADASGLRHVVVGIGLNVNHSAFPAELQSLATSLRIETGRAWPRSELLGALLQSLDREYRSLQSEPAAALLARFERSSSYARGRRVQVEEDGGYTGETAGLDARGFLQVRTATGLRTVISGGVRPIEDC